MDLLLSSSSKRKRSRTLQLYRRTLSSTTRVLQVTRCSPTSLTKAPSSSSKYCRGAQARTTYLPSKSAILKVLSSRSGQSKDTTSAPCSRVGSPKVTLELLKVISLCRVSTSTEWLFPSRRQNRAGSQLPRTKPSEQCRNSSSSSSSLHKDLIRYNLNSSQNLAQ